MLNLRTITIVSGVLILAVIVGQRLSIDSAVDRLKELDSKLYDIEMKARQQSRALDLFFGRFA